MLKIILALTLIGLTLAVKPIDSKLPFGAFQWKSCGSSSDHFNVSSVVMTPYPAVPGQNVTTNAHGYQDETVTGGTWEVKVYLYGFLVQDDTGNVCDLIPNCPCPCKAGYYTSVQKLYVTDLAPAGTYTGHYVAQDQNGDELVCIDFTFDVS